MNEETRTFIRVYLYVDGADQDLKGVLDGFSDRYTEAVCQGLSQVIAARELDVESYEALTDFAFPSEEDLYGYLDTVNRYVFHGSEERPWLPLY